MRKVWQIHHYIYFFLSPSCKAALLPLSKSRLRKEVVFALPPRMWWHISLSHWIQYRELGWGLRSRKTLDSILRQAGITKSGNTVLISSPGSQHEGMSQVWICYQSSWHTFASDHYLSSTIQNYISRICRGQGSSPIRIQLIKSGGKAI